MNRSLQQRLLASLIAAAVVTWLFIAVVNFAVTRAEVLRVFDSHLMQSAQLLRAVLDARGAGGLATAPAASPPATGTGSESTRQADDSQLIFQIAGTDGSLYLHSRGAPTTLLAGKESGYSETRIGEQRWRVYTLRDSIRPIVVYVAEAEAARNGFIFDLALKSLLLPLLGICILAYWIWHSIGTGLRPLRELARAVRNRDPLRLEPLPTGSLPPELVPLVSEINRLLKRLRQVLEGERRLTSDAAHELRTPLAGLKTQAQVALRAADDPARMHALKQLNRGIEEAIHLVEQMLILARMDPESGRHAFDAVDVSALANEAVKRLEPQAQAKHIDLRVDAGDAITLPCDPQAISILLRNLIDNAVRYTPADGEVSVNVEPVETGVLFTVSDTGPGIPVEEHRRVFERFYRGVDRRTPGSGLGMSIVQRIAELHGGDVQLHTVRPQGLRVEVLIPYPQILALAAGRYADGPTETSA